MVIGVLRIFFRLPETHSLKEKRWQLKSLTARIRSRFNVSIGEIDMQDKWQLAVLGVAHLSNDRAHSNQVLDQVLNFAENDRRMELTDSQMEFL